MKPSDASEQLRLEILAKEAAEYGAQKKQAAPAESEVSEQPVEEAVPIEELPPPTSQQMEQAESFIRQARLARTRGQGAQATAYLKQAEGVAPNAPAVLEFIGDDFIERKQYRNAKEVYAKAFKLAPDNVSLEKKFAFAVLKTTSFGGPEMYSEYEVMANSKIAIGLSAMVPGLGQLVTGEIAKGIGFMTVWVGCLAWLVLAPGGHPAANHGQESALKELISSLFAKGATTSLQPIIFLPLGIAVITYLCSLFDSSMKAKSSQRIKIDRPKPPENLPFE
jgi:tetratricopeptide (TPR) repeat protein